MPYDLPFPPLHESKKQSKDHDHLTPATQNKLICSTAAIEVELQKLKQQHPELNQLQNFTALFKQLTVQMGELLQPTYFTDPLQPQTTKNKAQRVFDVEELREMILLHVNVDDVFALAQVNKQFKDAIYGSRKMDEKLLFVPGKTNGAHLYIPLIDSPLAGIQVDLIGGAQRYGDHYEQVVCFTCWDFNKGPDQYVSGPRARKMLICNLPLNQLEVHVSCACCRGGGVGTFERPVGVVANNQQGVQEHTLGELIDHTNLERARHRDCVWAESGEHWEDGTVAVHVRFIGSVRLIDNDPIVQSSLKLQQEIQDDIQHSKRMENWKYYKMMSYLAGHEIPSFEQFLTNGGWSWNSQRAQ